MQMTDKQGWELLKQLGIDTDNQKIFEAVITIKVHSSVTVQIKRYIEFDGEIEEKKYHLKEIE